jgi:hypothetical protein
VTFPTRLILTICASSKNVFSSTVRQHLFTAWFIFLTAIPEIWVSIAASSRCRSTIGPIRRKRTLHRKVDVANVPRSSCSATF